MRTARESRSANWIAGPATASTLKLLWNSRTNRVTVAVEDERSGESFELEVDSADALAAFHHPYAHAQASARSLARSHPSAASGDE
jgi:hypothetical protein